MTSVSGQGSGASLSGLQPGLVPPTPLSSAVPEEIQPVIKDVPVDTSLEDDYGIVQDSISDNQDLGQDTGLSPNEPKTYATLLKSGSGSGAGYSVPLSNSNSNVFMPPPRSHSPPVSV